MIKNNICRLILLSIIIFLMLSCQEELVNEVIIYENDFSTLDLENFTTEQYIKSYENESVVGFFNNESISFRKDQLPSHDYLRVTLEIFIHDSWDGNATGIDGPDKWSLFIDNEMIVNTTFSNSPCESTYCLYQSFPENGLRQFTPKTGAADVNLPGRCQYEGINGWTTKYTISKIIAHTRSSVNIVAFDELRQLNTNDPKCDESWSLNKISISAINTNITL